MYRSIFILELLALLASAEYILSILPTSEYTDKRKECMAEIGIKPTKFESGLDDANERHTMDCFARCLLRKYGVISHNTTVGMTEDSPQWNVCYKEKAENECETAAKILECLAAQKIFLPFLDHVTIMKKEDAPRNNEIKGETTAPPEVKDDDFKTTEAAHSIKRETDAKPKSTDDIFLEPRPGNLIVS